MSTDRAGPQVDLTASQAWAMLREATVGRLAVVVDDQPDIFPVSFVVDHGSVVFRTAAGTKLAASQGRLVALEADGMDTREGTAWSVVVKGRAHVTRGLYESLDALALPLHPLVPDSKPHLVRIDVDEISGRWFTTITP